MRGKPVTKNEIRKIKQLREVGHSLPEICRALNRGSSTVHRFVKNVSVLPKYRRILKQKQGGSKKRAEESWKASALEVNKLFKRVAKRDRLFILASIYWGEGTKKELNLINSDPELIRVFISCLRDIGIAEKDLKLSLRLYDDIDVDVAKKYWAGICKVDIGHFTSINILKGKKKGKLPYGMCRVRVTNSGKFFKLIISMIGFIKNNV